MMETDIKKYNNKPLVSVVVPVFNVEAYLGGCVRSIVNQSYKNIETILVDDGSTDSSGKLCDELALSDKRIRVIHKENGGLSSARNAGIEDALGEYICFIDSDDYISESLVDIVVSQMQKENAEIGIWDYEEVEDGNETNVLDIITSMGIEKNCSVSASDKKSLLTISPSACNKMFRLEVFSNSNIRFPVGRNFEDLSTIPKLLAFAKRIVYVDSKPLYYYRIRKGSIMRSGKLEKRYNDRVSAITDLISYFKEKGIFDRYKNELEFLTFEHLYYVPSKELVAMKADKEYLRRHKEKAQELFPDMINNRYIKNKIVGKDKIMLFLLKLKLYGVMRLMSRLKNLIG